MALWISIVGEKVTTLADIYSFTLASLGISRSVNWAGPSRFGIDGLTNGRLPIRTITAMFAVAMLMTLFRPAGIAKTVAGIETRYPFRCTTSDFSREPLQIATKVAPTPIWIRSTTDHSNANIDAFLT